MPSWSILKLCCKFSVSRPRGLMRVTSMVCPGDPITTVGENTYPMGFRLASIWRELFPAATSLPLKVATWRPSPWRSVCPLRIDSPQWCTTCHFSMETNWRSRSWQASVTLVSVMTSLARAQVYVPSPGQPAWPDRLSRSPETVNVPFIGGSDLDQSPSLSVKIDVALEYIPSIGV